MHIQPQLVKPNFNVKRIVILALAFLITFLLFVGMQKLISSDNTIRLTTVDYPTVVIAHMEEETPTIKRIRIKPQKPPVPKPEPVAKILKAEPNAAINPTLYAGNYAGPIIKHNIQTQITAQNGDARPIVRVEPKYPVVAARDNIEGWVRLSFSITSTGTVDNIRVLEAQPKRVFDRAAKRALAKWKYKPNIQGGKAQPQDGMMVMLDFKIAS